MEKPTTTGSAISSTIAPSPATIEGAPIGQPVPGPTIAPANNEPAIGSISVARVNNIESSKKSKKRSAGNSSNRSNSKSSSSKKNGSTSKKGSDSSSSKKNNGSKKEMSGRY